MPSVSRMEKLLVIPCEFLSTAREGVCVEAVDTKGHFAFTSMQNCMVLFLNPEHPHNVVRTPPVA